MLNAIVRSVVVTGLDGRTYIAFQAYAEGYGIVAEGSRGFAEQAALNFNHKQRDQAITKALGIAPGETLRIELDEGA